MKIPILRALTKPKTFKRNIHFGKVILTFMLVCEMVLGVLIMYQPIIQNRGYWLQVLEKMHLLHLM